MVAVKRISSVVRRIGEKYMVGSDVVDDDGKGGLLTCAVFIRGVDTDGGCGVNGGVLLPLFVERLLSV